MIVDFSVLGVRGDWEGPYTILDATGKQVCCDAYLVDTVTGECKMLAFDWHGKLVRNSEGSPLPLSVVCPAPLKVLDRRGKELSCAIESPRPEAGRGIWIAGSHATRPKAKARKQTTKKTTNVSQATGPDHISQVVICATVIVQHQLVDPTLATPPQEPTEDEVNPCLVVVANG